MKIGWPPSTQIAMEILAVSKARRQNSCEAEGFLPRFLCVIDRDTGVLSA